MFFLKITKMIKKTILIINTILLLLFSTNSFAQKLTDEEKSQFKTVLVPYLDNYIKYGSFTENGENIS